MLIWRVPLSHFFSCSSLGWGLVARHPISLCPRHTHLIKVTHTHTDYSLYFPGCVIRTNTSSGKNIHLLAILSYCSTTMMHMSDTANTAKQPLINENPIIQDYSCTLPSSSSSLIGPMYCTILCSVSSVTILVPPWVEP